MPLLHSTPSARSHLLGSVQGPAEGLKQGCSWVHGPPCKPSTPIFIMYYSGAA